MFFHDPRCAMTLTHYHFSNIYMSKMIVLTITFQTFLGINSVLGLQQPKSVSDHYQINPLD